MEIQNSMTPATCANQRMNLSDCEGDRVLVVNCNDEEIRKPLKYIVALTGIKEGNLPDGNEKLILIDFIRENYRDYSPGELKYAFSKAMARNFDVDPNCYGSLSCEYIGRVLSAYEHYEKNGGSNGLPLKRYYSGSDDENRALVEFAFQKFLNGETNFFKYTSLIYGQLVSDGITKNPLKGSCSWRTYPKFVFIVNLFQKLKNADREHIYVATTTEKKYSK